MRVTPRVADYAEGMCWHEQMAGGVFHRNETPGLTSCFYLPPSPQGWPPTAGHVLALPTVQPVRVHSGVQGSLPGSSQPRRHLHSGEWLLRRRGGRLPGAGPPPRREGTQPSEGPVTARPHALQPRLDSGVHLDGLWRKAALTTDTLSAFAFPLARRLLCSWGVVPRLAGPVLPV